MRFETQQEPHVLPHGLVLNPSVENIERVRLALTFLPDQAVLNVRDTDLVEYQVVRVADEIVPTPAGRLLPGKVRDPTTGKSRSAS